jgi:alkanesulfonate monooxygenase SsuD/methylene tetrahydromethanopterin reductase-like flavin-dependent oxidoreductase (luciferase family)
LEFGASIFFTDYSITPAELAVAMEERGFDSVWAAEHSHIPVPRRTRADSELGKRYYDVMDPFVTLTAAAGATKRLKRATGICLVIQRDTIQTAKLVASRDQVSGGRFLSLERTAFSGMKASRNTSVLIRSGIQSSGLRSMTIPTQV